MGVQVRFQATPNPNAGKFTLDRPVVAGKASRSFYGPEQATGEPLAEALFGVGGVVSLFMVDDFVTVTKRPDANWAELAPRVVDAIERTLQ